MDAHRAARGDEHGDGADDDRHVARTIPSFAPERLASLRDAHLRRVADAGARCSSSCSTMFPDARHLPGLRHDRVVGGADRARSRGAPRRRASGCAPPAGRCPASCCRSRTPTATSLPAGRDRRGVRPRRATSCASTGTSPRRPPRRSAAAGTTPATRATSTRDGYLFLVDRVKDMIVTGGENVYSVEVENAIASHPDVAQVAVIGIPIGAVGRGGARDRRRARRRDASPRPRSSRTRASGSRATRCRSRWRSAPSRCRCRAR